MVTLLFEEEQAFSRNEKERKSKITVFLWWKPLIQLVWLIWYISLVLLFFLLQEAKGMRSFDMDMR